MLLHRNPVLRALAGFALAAAGTISQAAIVLNYGSFSGECGTTLSCVGNTAEVGGALRLTPASLNQAGAGYSTSAITLGANATFSTQFQFRITNSGGIAPADGLTFVLSAGISGLGSSGGGLGYAGVGNSVAVEFDTFNNGGIDNNSSNHVGVDTNGSMASAALASPYGRVICDFAAATIHTAAGCMSNGNVWTVVINYDGALLNVSAQDGNAAAMLLINNHAIDISSTLGTNSAFVGFTSGTGSGVGDHDILNWTLANDTSIVPPNQTPEPGTLALVGLALLGATWAKRRKLTTRG